MELNIFARFHARPGNEERAVRRRWLTCSPRPARSRDASSIHAFRSIRDPRLFYIHSRWTDEAAFDHHGGLPHTVRFVQRVEAVIDHPLDVTRAEPIG